jgi:hypothetical protein
MTRPDEKPLAARSRRARVALVLVAAATLGGGLYFARQSGTDPGAYGNDFNVYYFAAREVAAGRDPYERSLGQWTPYIYPPLLAELMIPLAQLPLPVAAYLWFLISAAATVAAAWMSAGLTGDDRRALIAAAALAVLARFVLDNFSLGQVNAVTTALAVAHVYLFAKDRKLASAFALALAISIKLTPAILLAYHLARRRVRFTLACAGLLVGVTALSLLPFGASAPDVLGRFVDRTIRNEQGYDLAYPGNQSLRGAVERLKADSPEAVERRDEGSTRKPADATTMLISLSLVALAGLAAWRARSEVAASAPFFCCMVMLSPLSWKAHFVMLLLPVAYLLCLALSRQKRRSWFVVAALVAAFALFNLTSPKVVGVAAAEWADAHSLVFAGAAIVYAATLMALGRRGLASA